MSSDGAVAELFRVHEEEKEKNFQARRMSEYIRPEIILFAEAMESAMRAHDAEKGDSWKECHIYELLIGLNKKFVKVTRAIYTLMHKDENLGKKELKIETVDLANYCAMVWNR